MTILFFLAPVAIWIIVARLVWGHKFSLLEMGMQLAVTAFFVTIVIFMAEHAQYYGTKMIHGSVESMDARKESCNMYWSRHPDGFCTNQQTRQVKVGRTCHKVDGKRVCKDDYETEYRSIYPWEIRYFVNTTIGGYEISREDRQGAITPKRFSEVQVSDPVSSTQSYRNYIGAASASLLNGKTIDQIKLKRPAVYDYWKVNQILWSDARAEEWNRSLMKVNSSLVSVGSNVIIAVTDKDISMADSIAMAWDAHNINDLVVTIGSADNETIDWVDVRSWSSSDLVNITIRDRISDLKKIDIDAINDIIQQEAMLNFKLRQPEDFEYLKDDITIPTWLLILVGFLLCVASPAMTYFFFEHGDF